MIIPPIARNSSRADVVFSKFYPFLKKAGIPENLLLLMG